MTNINKMIVYQIVLMILLLSFLPR